VSSPGSRDKCRTAPDGCRPLNQADITANAQGNAVFDDLPGLDLR